MKTKNRKKDGTETKEDELKEKKDVKEIWCTWEFMLSALIDAAAVNIVRSHCCRAVLLITFALVLVLLSSFPSFSPFPFWSVLHTYTWNHPKKSIYTTKIIIPIYFIPFKWTERKKKKKTMLLFLFILHFILRFLIVFICSQKISIRKKSHTKYPRIIRIEQKEFETKAKNWA